jgi:hypothetical protein
MNGMRDFFVSLGLFKRVDMHVINKHFPGATVKDLEHGIVVAPKKF